VSVNVINPPGSGDGGGGGTGTVSARVWDGDSYEEDTDLTLFVGAADPTAAPGGRDQDGDVWVNPAGVVPGQVIGAVYYDPEVEAGVGTTTTAWTDVDATNLIVTFTAPASGAVVVELEAWVNAGASTLMGWGIREGTTLINACNAQYAGAATGPRARVSLPVTGLTPGNAYTYKWAHNRGVGTGTCITRMGGRGAAGANVANDHPGPAVMRVVAL